MYTCSHPYTIHLICFKYFINFYNYHQSTRYKVQESINYKSKHIVIESNTYNDRIIVIYLAHEKNYHKRKENIIEFKGKTIQKLFSNEQR